jgi:hypothetical protein
MAQLVRTEIGDIGRFPSSAAWICYPRPLPQWVKLDADFARRRAMPVRRLTSDGRNEGPRERISVILFLFHAMERTPRATHLGRMPANRLVRANSSRRAR